MILKIGWKLDILILKHPGFHSSEDASFLRLPQQRLCFLAGHLRGCQLNPIWDGEVAPFFRYISSTLPKSKRMSSGHFFLSKKNPTLCGNLQPSRCNGLVFGGWRIVIDKFRTGHHFNPWTPSGKMEFFQNTLQKKYIYIYSLYIWKLICIYKHLYIYAICLILKGMWKEPQAPVTVG